MREVLFAWVAAAAACGAERPPSGVEPPDPDISTIAVEPASGLPADGVARATISLAARDARGRPIAGAVFTLDVTGAGWILTTTGPTGSDGRTTAFLASKAAGRKTVTATLNGSIVLRQQPDVEFVGGALEVKWSDGTALHEPPIDFGETPSCATDLRRTVVLENAGPGYVRFETLRIVEDVGGSFALENAGLGALAPGAAYRHLAVVFDDNPGLTNDGAKLRIVSDDARDAGAEGERLVPILTANAADLAPVPRIELCSGLDPTTQACLAVTPRVGEPLWADGRASTDPEGDAFTCAWSLTKPVSSTARLVGPGGEAPTPQDCVVQLVSDAGPGPDVPSGAGAGNLYRLDLRVTDPCGNRESIARLVQVAPG